MQVSLVKMSAADIVVPEASICTVEGVILFYAKGVMRKKERPKGPCTAKIELSPPT
jgi:hypothetical protein